MYKRHYAAACGITRSLTAFLRVRPLPVWLPGALSVLLLLPLSSIQAQKPQGKGKPRPAVPKATSIISTGRTLFQKNCATCHGSKGEGGEGPNLQNRTLTNSTIAITIKDGVKGEMPAFGSKFKEADIKALAAFVHSLKK